MRRAIPVVLLTTLLVAMPAGALAIESGTVTSGAELASADSGLDGQTVTLEGEVVSELLRGGDGHVWVNVLSEGVAIGVWAPTNLTEDLTVFGNWGHDGDRISVTGVFNEACDVHGGDLDVHAASITLVAAGEPRENPVALWKLGVALGGIALALVLYWRSQRVQEEGFQ